MSNFKKVQKRFLDRGTTSPSPQDMLGQMMDAVAREVDEIIVSNEQHGASEAARHCCSLFDRLDDRPSEMDIYGEKKALACGKGCWFCCTVRVSTIAPEVFMVADHIRETFNAEEMEALKARIAAFEEKGKKYTPIQYVLEPRLCPLNVDGECTVYEARPLACRSYHSYDVAKCEKDMKNPYGDPVVPLYPGSMGLRQTISAGCIGGLSRRGLDTTELEFVTALGLALENEAAQQEYLGGSQPFSAADRPDIREEQKKDVGIKIPRAKSW